MPKYFYKCKKCFEKWEQWRSLKSGCPICPSCGTDETLKLPSAVYIKSKSNQKALKNKKIGETTVEYIEANREILKKMKEAAEDEKK